MDWSMIMVATLGLLVAGIVKGATGLGYASCALPFLVIAIGLTPAMALVIAPAMSTNISLALSTGHLLETVSRFRVLYVSMIPGIVVGINLLLWISQTVAIRTLGVVIIAYGLMSLARPAISMPVRFEKPMQAPTGFLNGVMTGMTGAQVMPLFPYMMALNLEPDRMVQAINLAVMIASAFLAVGLIASGIMTWQLLLASIVAIIPALIGVEIGSKARKLIPAQQFRQVALLTLSLLGFLMLVK